MNAHERPSSSDRQMPEHSGPASSSTSAIAACNVRASTSVDSPEGWFFRIDGKEYGPATRAQLEYLLAPPRICSSLQVLCTLKEGKWHTIGSQDTLSKVLAMSGNVVQETSQHAVRTPRVNRLWEQLHDACDLSLCWLSRHAKAIFFILGIMVVNSIALYLGRDPYLRDREILSRYELIWQSVETFERGTTSHEEWRRFSRTALAELELLTKELSRTASVKHAARQNLMYLGKEDLPNLLNLEQVPEIDCPQALLVKRRLRLACDQLGQESHS